MCIFFVKIIFSEIKVLNFSLSLEYFIDVCETIRGGFPKIVNLEGGAKKTKHTVFDIQSYLLILQKCPLIHQKDNIHSFEKWYYNCI